MVIRFLLTVIGCLMLAACTTGAPGQPVVIVVTATPAPQNAAPGAGVPAAATAAQPVATQPAAPAVPAATLVPTTGAAPAATVPAVPTPTFTSAAGAAALPTPTTAAGAVVPAVPATGPVPVSLDMLLDYSVVDASGNFLGEVKDAVVERGSAGVGQIPYLVIDSNLKNDWNIPVPWNRVQLRPELQAVMVPVNATQLASAPGFNDEIWPASLAGANNVVQNFWANPGQGGAMAPVLPGGFTTGYLRASDVMSVDILNQQGLKLGDIQDIAIDWQNSQPASAQAGQFRYLLMEMNDDFGFDNRMIPIPWARVNLNPNQENVVVNLAQNLMLTAPNFLKGSLPDLYAEPLSGQLRQFWP